MKYQINLEFLPEPEAEKYKDKEYIVVSEKFGKYTKKEAEAISHFIKWNCDKFLRYLEEKSK